jgi:hypothetical protein
MKLKQPSSPADTVRFSCCGVRITIEFDSLVPPSEIRAILPPESSEFASADAEHCFSLRRSSGTGDEPYPTYLVGTPNRVSPPQCLGPALIALRKAIHLCIAEHSRDRVFIHAGVAAWNGRAIVCPGRSHSGKSTLIWSMLNSGATYYSDEYAVFDSNGHIHPFPLPISLRVADGHGRSITAGRIGTEPLSTSLILFAQYRKNQKWEPGVLTPGQTLLGLMKNSLSMRRNPSTVLRVLKSVALITKGYAGERDEAYTVIDWLKYLKYK